jgi:ABC-2 type transport system ATP-binding protein
MIHVEHLVKRYGRQTAVDDISFTCRPGTITSFPAPTAPASPLRMTGLTPPSAGRVTIDGIP